MAGYNKEEALAFVEAIRLSLDGKVGFKWLVERLSDLSAYIETVTADNERLNAYLDWSHSREEYESFCAATYDTLPESGAAEQS